jgi:riboflavin kinase/FMN adenylyltransferase
MVALQIPVNEMRVCARGEVVRGDQRGRLLGFPTANIAIDAESCLAPDGVYAGYLHRYRSCHAAAISLGRRTTFYDAGGLRLLEAHLLDFSGDLYGEIVTVELAAQLRGQVKFAGPDALCAQLEIDVSRCRDVLTRCAPSRRDGWATSTLRHLGGHGLESETVATQLS